MRSFYGALIYSLIIFCREGRYNRMLHASASRFDFRWGLVWRFCFSRLCLGVLTH